MESSLGGNIKEKYEKGYSSGEDETGDDDKYCVAILLFNRSCRIRYCESYLVYQ